jgi:hypothetical protein
LQGLTFSQADSEAIRLYSHSRGIRTAKDLFNAGQWLPLEHIEGRICSTREVRKQQFSILLEWLSASPGLTSDCLKSSPGWCWIHDGIKRKGWALRTQHWRSLLPRATLNFAQLNARWTLNWISAAWAKLWQNLWKGSGHPWSQLVLWRVLQHSFYTNSRGALWGVSLPECPRCHLHKESIVHVFFLCQEVRLRWSSILSLLAGLSVTFGCIQTPMDTNLCNNAAQEKPSKAHCCC